MKERIKNDDFIWKKRRKKRRRNDHFLHVKYDLNDGN